MLKNDEVFWRPTAKQNAPYLSWGNSGGDFSLLWDHARTRWGHILRTLTQAGIRHPSGRIVEFGAGMGLLDELIDDRESTITMLDHSAAYIAERPHPLSARCRHILWSEESLDRIQAEPSSYDWLISIAVFYHVDDLTAAALLLELGRLLRPGGHVLLQGFTAASAEKARAAADKRRLFARYPTYALNLDLLRGALAPDYEELCRDEVLVYRKRQPS